MQKGSSQQHRGSGSTELPRHFLAAVSECRVVMSDLSGQAALDRVCLSVVQGILAHCSLLCQGGLPPA